ncbi:hypothetical protein BKA82DRAFT_994165 [Pisolithus tinctorius]|uniref:Uncharacterized protein n=1 Tax=Pisolithus tinctorius Marx 270 TaxID=870435 RepID=A0A0C3PU01_PISTI|nr:hypothetical protein BKA82DRAFT_994165 [Pisolithus tinctorius]KIO12214.1 hypothetical protein M404DRAFT_994165 [Pisolithus tinctorius Marx 270]
MRQVLAPCALVIFCTSTMTLSPRVSYIRLRKARDIESVELVLGESRHHIPKRGKGVFSRDFDEPLMLAMEQLSLLLHHKKSRFGFCLQTVSEPISISSAEILSRLQRQRVQGKRGEAVSVTLGVFHVTVGVLFQTSPEREREPRRLLNVRTDASDS